MIRKIYWRSFNIFFVICIITLTFSLLGCSHVSYTRIEYSGGENYKTFVTPEGNYLRLSFEYPSIYILGYEPYYEHSLIHLHVPTSQKYYSGNEKILLTIACIGKGDFKNAEMTISELITFCKERGYVDFQVKDKRKITTAEGLEGWEVVMTYKYPPVSEYPHKIELSIPAEIVSRTVAFDFRGIVVDISLLTDVDSYKQTKVDFEHILKTLEVAKYIPSN